MNTNQAKGPEQDIDLAVKLRLLSILRSDCIHKERPKKHAAEEARRDMLDSIAYLCDIRKGGSTVTAVALQQEKRNKAILWLAANEGVTLEVKKLVGQLLEHARKVKLGDIEEIETNMLAICLDMATNRINFYQARLMENLRKCQKQLNGRCILSYKAGKVYHH
jgi:hypothetical protein